MGGDSIDKIRAPVHAPARVQGGACFNSIEMDCVLKFLPEFMPKMPISKGYRNNRSLSYFRHKERKHLGHKLGHGIFCPIVNLAGNSIAKIPISSLCPCKFSIKKCQKSQFIQVSLSKKNLCQRPNTGTNSDMDFLLATTNIQHPQSQTKVTTGGKRHKLINFSRRSLPHDSEETMF